MPTRILLIGGGHTHIEVLRRLAQSNDATLALTLVSPRAVSFYSGMLPGVVAGLYRRSDAAIALPPLADAARAEYVEDRVTALDLQERTATLARAQALAFDLVSLDVGSRPPGIGDAVHGVVAARPDAGFFEAWQQARYEIAAGIVRHVAVIGAGAGGIELALAIDAACRSIAGCSASVTLFADTPTIATGHGERARERLARTLQERGIEVRTACRIVATEPGQVVGENGQRWPADRVFLATGAVAPPWLAASGLACDAQGFVRVDATLRSTSHPFVFASGDCATVAGERYPRSGANAVRQGPTLALNLAAIVRKGELTRFAGRERTLALIGSGDRRAVLSWGAFGAEGAWLWRLKDRIDRRHVARYALPPRRSDEVRSQRPDR